MPHHSSRSRAALASLVLLAVASTIAATAARAQQPAGRFPRDFGQDPSIMDVILPKPNLEVRKVGADGTIELGPEKTVIPVIARVLSFQYAEGHYLLLAGDGVNAPGDVLHVEVTDLAENARITVRTTPDAAAKIAAGTPVALVMNGAEIIAPDAVPTHPVVFNPAPAVKILRIRGAGDQARASIE